MKGRVSVYASKDGVTFSYRYEIEIQFGYRQLDN